MSSSRKKESSIVSNFHELSLIDDVAKILLIDPRLGFEVKKMDLIAVNFLQCETHSILEILDKFMAHHGNDEIIKNLMKFFILEKIPGDFPFLVQNLQNHLNIYLNFLSLLSGFLVTETKRYTSNNYKQVTVIANMDLNKKVKLE